MSKNGGLQGSRLITLPTRRRAESRVYWHLDPIGTVCQKVDLAAWFAVTWFAVTGGVGNEELSSHTHPCRHASRRHCGGSLRRADPVVAAFSAHRHLLVLANRYPRCRSRQTSACTSSGERSRSRKAAPVSACSTDHQLLVLANRYHRRSCQAQACSSNGERPRNRKSAPAVQALELHHFGGHRVLGSGRNALHRRGALGVWAPRRG